MARGGLRRRVWVEDSGIRPAVPFERPRQSAEVRIAELSRGRQAGETLWAKSPANGDGLFGTPRKVK